MKGRRKVGWQGNRAENHWGFLQDEPTKRALVIKYEHRNIEFAELTLDTFGTMYSPLVIK